MKKVLITGANSYIGTSFEKYAYEHYAEDFEIDTLDMKAEGWRDNNFGGYDIVFHVAGIAHVDVSNVNEDIKAKYYAVNTGLAIETAQKAKRDGVGQFVFMSSAIVYGDSAPYGKRKRITKETEPSPSNFYGDSKWKADKGVRELADTSFNVAVLRSPMIYGKGSKGNYPLLARLAKQLPIFPDIQNERSVLYVENLCEFLCQVMLKNAGGIFWPQNAEYIRTTELVVLIGKIANHPIYVSNCCNWMVSLARLISGKMRRMTDKAFGSLSYDQLMSKYDFEYQIFNLKESIKRTEGE